MFQLIVDQLRWYGYHGVHAFEKEEGQPFVIDAVIHTDIGFLQEDDLAGTISYSDCIKAMKRVFFKKKYDLLEYLCQDMAKALFDFDPRITAVDVTVKKTRPPVREEMEGLGVRLQCTRSI